MYHTHVVDPETGEIIPLYNEKIYKLLNSGVSLTDLKPYVSEKYNRNSLFTNDLICEYLKYFNGYRHMKALLLVDKSTTTLINNKYVWKKIFIKHKFPHYGEYNLSNFIKIKNAFNTLFLLNNPLPSNTIITLSIHTKSSWKKPSLAYLA